MKNRSEIEILHENAFLGRSDYIPLCIKVLNPAAPPISRWEMTADPEKALVFGLENIRLSREVGSDWLPTITNYYQDILIPSFFGAEPFDAKDFNPMPKPFIRDLAGIGSFRLEDLCHHNRLLETAIAHFNHLRARVPEGVEVLAPTVTSPLDYALNMRGGAFLMDMIDAPETSQDFLGLLTELIIFQVKTFKRISGQAGGSYTTTRGQHFPGLRIACDSIINLSPAMIRRFMFPVFARLAGEFKRLLVHFCTTPAPSTHVLPVLMESPHVCGVDNWQGYRTFFSESSGLLRQEKLAICTDLPVGRLLEELREPFFAEVRRKNGRGLLATVTVDSVDEGKRILGEWRKRFGGGS